MKKKSAFQHIFRLSYSYLLFFLATAFVVSCCMLLFLKTMHIVFTEENIRTAAALTFGNTLLISLLAIEPNHAYCMIAFYKFFHFVIVLAELFFYNQIILRQRKSPTDDCPCLATRVIIP